MHHRPHSARDILHARRQPFAIIREVDTPLHDLSREGRRVALPLPADARRVAHAQAHVKAYTAPLKQARAIVVNRAPIAERNAKEKDECFSIASSQKLRLDGVKVTI